MLLILLTVSSLAIFAQSQRPSTPPKLVLGIVVDQMRYDYLFRYWNKYGEGGFRRLLKEGHNCENTMYNYVPTYTGPGHASIYAGTTPSVHGIVSNDWYVKKKKKEIYCVSDSTMQSVGTSTAAGKMSPVNLLASNISDELRLANVKKSKVIAIAIKDRSSILPAGHNANAAYWYDGTTGDFISSSFYMNDLPQWVKDFNAQKLADKYLSKDWNTLLPIKEYTESIADSNAYEGLFAGEKNSKFPHKLPEIRQYKGYSTIAPTPFGSSLTKDLALQAIEKEDLGMDEYPDLLAVSFSSPDYVGHQFGPSSVEVEDTYLRLDRDLAEILAYAEKKVGKGNVLVFLTADHGAVHNAKYLMDNKIPAGRFDSHQIRKELNTYTYEHYKDSMVLEVTNQQVYLDDEKINALGYA
ncbi:MAG: alkaline phosphatase family protein, partial [Bacteroidales bacterium]